MELNEIMFSAMTGITVVSLLLVGILVVLVVKLKTGMDNLFELTREGFVHSARELSTSSTAARQESQQGLALFQESLLNRISGGMTAQQQKLDVVEAALNRTAQAMLSRQDVFNEKMERGMQSLEQRIHADGFQAREELKKSLFSFEKMLQEHLAHQDRQQQDRHQAMRDTVVRMKEEMKEALVTLQQENSRRLKEIRHTVDEKLQDTLEKRLGESFQLVSRQLEQVSRGIGEMQTLANGVGDLKKVLSNVKTRGMLGEYQLGAILEEILSPHQFARDVRTRKGTSDHVEFAVVLPGDNNQKLFMPLDSKFPLTVYENLLAASDSGDADAVKNSRQVLSRAISGFARDIAHKYIDPPHTTDFGVMFLPVEGLYAEVVRDVALVERLQRELHIILTGPTTLAAFLNALQMGFRTLAIQKRSSQVWQVLSTVKTEFGKFGRQLDKVEKHFNTARTSLTELKNTRSRMLDRKLQQVETLALDDDG